MRIELLTFEGCPNVEETERRILAALHDEGCAADVVHVQISSTQEAFGLRFLGSPSVRINGEDIEPLARDGLTPGFACRMYASDVAAGGTPPVTMIRAAIRRHVERST